MWVCLSLYIYIYIYVYCIYYKCPRSLDPFYTVSYSNYIMGQDFLGIQYIIFCIKWKCRLCGSVCPPLSLSLFESRHLLWKFLFTAKTGNLQGCLRVWSREGQALRQPCKFRNLAIILDKDWIQILTWSKYPDLKSLLKANWSIEIYKPPTH